MEHSSLSNRKTQSETEICQGASLILNPKVSTSPNPKKYPHPQQLKLHESERVSAKCDSAGTLRVASSPEMRPPVEPLLVADTKSIEVPEKCTMREPDDIYVYETNEVNNHIPDSPSSLVRALHYQRQIAFDGYDDSGYATTSSLPSMPRLALAEDYTTEEFVDTNGEEIVVEAVRQINSFISSSSIHEDDEIGSVTSPAGLYDEVASDNIPQASASVYDNVDGDGNVDDCMSFVARHRDTEFDVILF